MACIAGGLAAGSVLAGAAELVGRVVDTVHAVAHAGAQVRLRGVVSAAPGASTDAQGFFRMPGLAPGAYLLDVALADGRAFMVRTVLLPGRKTHFVELDYSRAAPPDDDADY